MKTAIKGYVDAVAARLRAQQAPHVAAGTSEGELAVVVDSIVRVVRRVTPDAKRYQVLAISGDGAILRLDTGAYVIADAEGSGFVASGRDVVTVLRDAETPAAAVDTVLARWALWLHYIGKAKRIGMPA